MQTTVNKERSILGELLMATTKAIIEDGRAKLEEDPNYAGKERAEAAIKRRKDAEKEILLAEKRAEATKLYNAKRGRT